MPVKPIPDGFHTLTPHLVMKDASKAIDFYKKAFGAEEIARMVDAPLTSTVGRAKSPPFLSAVKA